MPRQGLVRRTGGMELRAMVVTATPAGPRNPRRRADDSTAPRKGLHVLDHHVQGLASSVDLAGCRLDLPGCGLYVAISRDDHGIQRALCTVLNFDHGGLMVGPEAGHTGWRRVGLPRLGGSLYRGCGCFELRRARIRQRPERSTNCRGGEIGESIGESREVCIAA